MTEDDHGIPSEIRSDVETLFAYNQLNDHLQPADVGIGLGSHDPNVPIQAAHLYKQGLFPLVVFSGANAPTTVERFPRGEAIHYREVAEAQGVPDPAILVETHATNTGENVRFTRQLLSEQGIRPASGIVICRPYQQRRASLTFRSLWPDLAARFTSRELPLDSYVRSIGNARFVVEMIVGDTQRAIEKPPPGILKEPVVPDSVRRAYTRLAAAGYGGRLV